MKASGFLFVASLTACNSFTGLDDLEVDDEGGESQAALALADGVSITKIDLYQGIRRPLMELGAPAASPITMVRERDAFLRVHYALAGAPVVGLTARLTMGDAEPLEVPTAAGVPSSDDVLASTINIPIPGELMIGTDYRVELLQKREVTSGDNEAASYPPPDADRAPLSLQGTGPLRLVIVPVQYDADGTGRLPDTSETQLQVIRDTFYGVYPVPEVDIRVTDPFPSSTPISGLGEGWDTLLSEISDFRSQNGAAPDEYYLGLFMATDSFGDFCQGGCITGLSHLAFSPGDSHARASIAIGFPGQASADTAVHEVGHAHGREHSPCGGAGGPDPNFPHADGSIGTWGYDLTSGKLLEPSTADFMSYCEPTWVSDYSWEALFTRGQLVNVAMKIEPGPPQAYDRLLVRPDGTAVFHGRITLRQAPDALRIPVQLDGVQLDDREVEGHFYPYDHLDGGTLLVPASDAREARFVAAGRAHLVTR